MKQSSARLNIKMRYFVIGSEVWETLAEVCECQMVAWIKRQDLLLEWKKILLNTKRKLRIVSVPGMSGGWESTLRIPVALQGLFRERNAEYRKTYSITHHRSLTYGKEK